MTDIKKIFINIYNALLIALGVMMILSPVTVGMLMVARVLGLIDSVGGGSGYNEHHTQ